MVASTYDDWKVLFMASASWRSKKRCAFADFFFVARDAGVGYEEVKDKKSASCFRPSSQRCVPLWCEGGLQKAQ